MGPSVARGLPRCESPTQDEALLRYMRTEYSAAGVAWTLNGSSPAARTGLGLRAWFRSVVRPLRGRSPAPSAVHAHADIAAVHFAEASSAPHAPKHAHDLVAAPVLAVAVGCDSAPTCPHPHEQ